jgi:hypothetical protein
MKVNFKLTETQFEELKSHLHPGDGLEAIAFGLCGRLNNSKSNTLLLHELFLLPHNECERAYDFVKWKIDSVEHLLEKALENDFAIVKIHSHGIINSDFSNLDDKSDKDFFECVYAWVDTDLPHLSLIMYPDGSFKGRSIDNKLEFHDLSSLNIVGEKFVKKDFTENSYYKEIEKYIERNKQAFGNKTTDILSSLKIGIVGCSGTGSPTIEQLVRLGVGKILLVDNDRGELANMNRIYGLKMEDAASHKLKVEAIKEHIESIGFGTEVTIMPYLVQDSQKAIDELASCDIIFGCVDSAEGRHILNLISHYYLVPLIDLGVKFRANGFGGIESINGNIHYVFPGSASLLQRKVYSSKLLADEELRRTDSEEYINRKQYFDNAEVSSPAVISVNTLISALGVCEMLSRIHPYRYSDNSNYCSTHLNLCDWDISYDTINVENSRFFGIDTLGIGNKQPLIRINHEKDSQVV